jgi:hypothetical protein
VRTKRIEAQKTNSELPVLLQPDRFQFLMSSLWVGQVQQDANAILSALSFALWPHVLFVKIMNLSGEERELR